jgi:hypothetical protein
MHRIRKRLTYANVMSSIAVFIILGGAAYAASQLPKNSVGTKQLKKNAVIGSKVKDGSLTGADINSATLGTVPSATSAGHATSADTANSAGNANTTDGRSLGCPTGTQEYAGACIESATRVAATWSTASKTCGDAGRRLPTTSELDGFRQVSGITLGSPSETTSTVTDDNTTEFKITINDEGEIFGISLGSARPYRCVASLVQ